MGTVTFQSCVSPSRALRAYTCQRIPELPLPDAFGKWSTHADGEDGGGGRGGRTVKNGRKKWGRTGRGGAGLGSEIRGGSII